MNDRADDLDLALRVNTTTLRERGARTWLRQRTAPRKPPRSQPSPDPAPTRTLLPRQDRPPVVADARAADQDSAFQSRSHGSPAHDARTADTQAYRVPAISSSTGGSDRKVSAGRNAVQ
jgi:hypothetical protein